MENFKQILDRLIQASGHLVAPSCPLAVAVSGGSDSMAMALLAKQFGFEVVALTVDHQLRPESGREAAQVAEWMAAHQIPHYILPWEHAEVQGNLQAAARKARYQLLTQFCKDKQLKALLVAHTEDDQAETIAMRQARAAGAVGLAGMSAVSEQYGVTILRPLLAVTRKALRDYLLHEKQPWIDDPSNENTDFDRIRIRKELVQDSVKRDALLMLGRAMAGERESIERAHSDFVKNAVQIAAPQQLQVNRTLWNILPQEQAIYTISRLLMAVSGREYPPRHHELLTLYTQMQSAKGKATLGKCMIVWNQERATISPEGVEMPRGNAHLLTESNSNALAKPLVTQPFYSIQKAL